VINSGDGIFPQNGQEPSGRTAIGGISRWQNGQIMLAITTGTIVLQMAFQDNRHRHDGDRPESSSFCLNAAQRRDILSVSHVLSGMFLHTHRSSAHGAACTGEKLSRSELVQDCETGVSPRRQSCRAAQGHKENAEPLTQSSEPRRFGARASSPRVHHNEGRVVLVTARFSYWDVWALFPASATATPNRSTSWLGSSRWLASETLFSGVKISGRDA
jgi:hypothetical protein